MREKIALTAFTGRGRTLAETLAAALGGEVRGGEQPLAEWTAEGFREAAALIFVGALGIAVRSIAPHVKSKAEDPAVLCVDEGGHWVIPVLSGHLGGANALARQVAALTGGEAVITTATDLNGCFAVDLWAKKQGLAVLEPERIKKVSARLLKNEAISVECPWPIAGSAPERVRLGSGGDVRISYRLNHTEALQLAPRVLTLGVGCRQGVEEKELESAFQRFCAERGIVPQAIERAASIDRKQGEAGLLAFCAAHGWPLSFYSAEELRAVPGNFTASVFVENTVGVENVCERAAARASGGELIEWKFAGDGVTFALAARRTELDWTWRDG